MIRDSKPTSCPAAVILLAVFFVVPLCVLPASGQWQYRVPFDRGPDRSGNPQAPGNALLWIPPEATTIRGVLLAGQLGIEDELVSDPEVRRACREHQVAIIYFVPHLSGVFHFWKEDSRDAERLLRALDDLAKASGYGELRRVPWITVGHSTAGIFARNVAYWQPQRVAAVLHIKSGNFHQQEHLPPRGSLVGIPLTAINGQFETFGPEGGIRPEWGRETQWVFVLRDLQRFRQRDPQHLMSLLVQPGDDHFHGSPEIGAFVARWLTKTAQYRLPERLPGGSGPVACQPRRAEEGWLSDPDLYRPQHPPAAYGDYAGDRALALWHYDADMAEAVGRFHERLGNHQAISNPECIWLDEGAGYRFRASAQFLDTMPEQFGGSVGGQRIGRPKTPFVFRSKSNEPVRQIGPDTFELLRPVRRVHIAAFHPGDDHFRSTVRWGSLDFQRPRDASSQTIDFPAIGDVAAGATTIRLAARASSGLPVVYEVNFGPASVEGDRLRIAEIPRRGRLPIPCSVTAYQIGRRVAPAVEPAEPVTVTFRIIGP